MLPFVNGQRYVFQGILGTAIVTKSQTEKFQAGKLRLLMSATMGVRCNLLILAGNIMKGCREESFQVIQIIACITQKEESVQAGIHSVREN